MVGDDGDGGGGNDNEEEVDARLNSCLSNLGFRRMPGDKIFPFLIFTAFCLTKNLALKSDTNNYIIFFCW